MIYKNILEDASCAAWRRWQEQEAEYQRSMERYDYRWLPNVSLWDEGFRQQRAFLVVAVMHHHDCDYDVAQGHIEYALRSCLL